MRVQFLRENMYENTTKYDLSYIFLKALHNKNDSTLLRCMFYCLFASRAILKAFFITASEIGSRSQQTDHAT